MLRSWRWPATIALALVFAVAFLTFTLAQVARNDFLDASFYTDALEENRVYERFYSEVLSDPELTEIVSQFLGDVEVERSVAVSILRTMIPPDSLQEATEAIIEDLIAYLRGETQRLDTFIDLTDAIGLQGLALSAYFQNQVVLVPNSDSDEIDLTSIARSISENLSDGRLPGSIPSASVPPDLIEAVADAILSPVNDVVSGEVKRQVIAALTIDDLRSAFAVAATALTGSTLEDAEAGLRDFLGEDGGLDPVVLLSDLSELTEEELLTPLNQTRSDLRILFAWWMTGGLIFVMLISIGAIVIVSPSPRAGIRTIGITFTTLAIVIVVIGWQAGPQLISAATGSPVINATQPQDGVPDSVARILRDVGDTLLAELSESLRTAGYFLLVPGIVLIAISQMWHWRIEFVFRHRYWAKFLEITLPVAFLIVAVVVFEAATPAQYAVANDLKCNGSPELCDRPYDEIAYPTTHNAMSSANEGWLLPTHDRNIPQQLKSGVRALMIDTHYWTDAQNVTEAFVARVDLDAETVEVLAGIISHFGEGPPGLWLCHATCWLGATSLHETLVEIRSFLEEHPREVITLIIQDMVDVEDTSNAFKDAELDQYLFELAPDASWPTLGSMIDSGRRLVVFSESSSPPPAWNHSAFELMQETPFNFESSDSFTCDQGRGPSTAGLLLMNHWVAKPSPDRVDSAQVNEFEFLMARAQQCESERGQLPNFIAVNFSSLGDLFAVVDELNTVR